MARKLAGDPPTALADDAAFWEKFEARGARGPSTPHCSHPARARSRRASSSAAATLRTCASLATSMRGGASCPPRAAPTQRRTAGGARRRYVAAKVVDKTKAAAGSGEGEAACLIEYEALLRCASSSSAYARRH